jgi:hypothetical protein
MTEVKNVKVAFLDNAIIKSGLPMAVNFEDFNRSTPTEDDIKRAYKLVINDPGTGHNNFIKGICVTFDLKYPEYISPEMQRYHWYEIVSSMSKMHRLCKMGISENNTNKYVDKRIIDIVNEKINIYNSEPNYENFMKVLSNTPLGFEKWMTIVTNYLQLKTIYFQRRFHKLQEDWSAVIDMIKSLPMSDLIIKRKGE